MTRRGYADHPDRVPPGWRVLSQDHWPVNNPTPGRGAVTDLVNWRFTTCGEVDNPLELTYEMFQLLPHVSKTLDHHCIDGWSYLGQRWSGVDIEVIKEATRVRGGARYMMIEGDHVSSQRFPIDQDILLADHQDGEKLAKTVGYPLRVVAPGEYGYRSRKWISRIRFCTDFEQDELERGFEKAGAYDVYTSKIRSANPWTVDNEARKRFLRVVFADETDEVRQKRKQDCLMGRNTIQKVEPSDGQDEARLCAADSLGQSSAGLRLSVNGSEVLLVRCGDEIYATEPLCSHMGTDLANGQIDRNARTLKCPLHGALFDFTTGRCLSGSYGADPDAFPPIRKYRIRVVGNDVFLEREQDWGRVW